MHKNKQEFFSYCPDRQYLDHCESVEPQTLWACCSDPILAQWYQHSSPVSKLHHQYCQTWVPYIPPTSTRKNNINYKKRHSKIPHGKASKSWVQLNFDLKYSIIQNSICVKWEDWFCSNVKYYKRVHISSRKQKE